MYKKIKISILVVGLFICLLVPFNLLVNSKQFVLDTSNISTLENGCGSLTKAELQNQLSEQGINLSMEIETLEVGECSVYNFISFDTKYSVNDSGLVNYEKL